MYQQLRLHVLPEELDDFDMLVNLPAGFRARIGLNETTLTRALARGDFAMAEKIIEEVVVSQIFKTHFVTFCSGHRC